MARESDAGDRFSRSSALLAAVLTMAAGYVDAIGYLNLGHVYVANMSGNSIGLGIGVGWRDTHRVLHYALPLASFFCGLAFARVLVDLGVALRWRALAAPALGLESLALAGLLVFPGGTAGILFGGVAMGIQAATLSRFNGASVYTAFVTGSMVKAAENLSNVAVALLRRARPNRKHLRYGVWFMLLWASYVGGAVGGVIALGGLGTASVAIAVALIAGVGVVDLLFPARLDRDVR